VRDFVRNVPQIMSARAQPIDNTSKSVLEKQILIWGSQSGVAEDSRILGCDAVPFGLWFTTFRTNVVASKRQQHVTTNVKKLTNPEMIIFYSFLSSCPLSLKFFCELFRRILRTFVISNY